MIRPGWLISQLIPPALLTYFGRTLYLCVTEIGPIYLGKGGYPTFGAVYSATAIVLIPSVSFLFLRLYFLPSTQSLPPRDPPLSIQKRTVLFECLAPAEAEAVRSANGGSEGDEDEPLVNRCWKGNCKGRWKPSRARHCSECGTCRAGFDHHCAFFANCLTAPYLPTFMALVTLTPIIIVLLSLPLYIPLFKRSMEAYNVSWSEESIRTWWYGWRWSWIIAAGPVGRYIGGIVLGWKVLDRVNGGGSMRLEVGILVAIGMMLTLITGALGAATVGVIRTGYLTVDRERARSLTRAREAIDTLKKAGKPIPAETIRSIEKYIDRHYFWVPDQNKPNGGKILEYRGDRGPYDRGSRGNWEFIMGKGWGWVLPWIAIKRGISIETCLNWPLSKEAQKIILDEDSIE